VYSVDIAIYRPNYSLAICTHSTVQIRIPGQVITTEITLVIFKFSSKDIINDLKSVLKSCPDDDSFFVIKYLHIGHITPRSFKFPQLIIIMIMIMIFNSNIITVVVVVGLIVAVVVVIQQC
jgi:hypothetical protein